MFSLKQAKISDKAFVVPLIFSSGPDAFNFVFTTNTRSAIDFLHFAYQQPKGTFSHNHHQVLTKAEDTVAAGTLMQASNVLVDNFHVAKQIIRFYGVFSGLKVMFRGLRTESVIKPPAKGRGYLAHLGVPDAKQGNGYGKQLVALLEQQAKSLGLAKVALDVSMENPNAKRLYARLGYSVRRFNSSTLKNDFGHVPSHEYMEKTL
ncbi:GNAT family N-acetyltransferase [Litorilituus lipolyticus]|uniref:GNAT family N-acetyltransferase n=1 Tax=Litorilituus lipolyticus TaxID=2491017 RepID=A0A502KVT8_9GAMM|nr:GNAT family N-acetyltransferase [Litorilituus lipolyticus]TPH15722.1 GNAT family N-acetyltransferase [Litorilituus lipolyticus]